MSIYITQTGKKNLEYKVKQLSFELANLHKEKSQAYRRDGDGTHDNPHYQDLKNREGLLIKQIAEIQHSLSDSILINVSERDTNVVRLGSIIKCSVNNSEERIFEIVGYGEQIDEKKVSYLAPVGRALIGLKRGDKCEVVLPKKTVSYTVLDFFKEMP